MYESVDAFWGWQNDFGKKALLYEKCVLKMLMKLTTASWQLAFSLYQCLSVPLLQ